MGKAKPSKATEEELEVDEEANAELEAEIQALNAIRAEREEASESAEGKAKRMRGMYNNEGLENALAARLDLPFLETYEVCEFDAELADDNDDLAREMAFYNQSMLAVTAGRQRLKQLGVPLRRPDDFFAENLKTDVHMARIKDKLLLETKKMDAFEKRQQRESSRKYNKQIMEMKKQERSDKTKENIEDFTKLRKKGLSGEQIDEKVEKMLGRGQGDRTRTEKSSKRKAMDKKYGGRAKEAMKNKLNDRKSFNDMSDYNPRGGKQVRRELQKSKPGSLGRKDGSSGGGAYKANGKAKAGGKIGRPGKGNRSRAGGGGRKGAKF